MVPSVRVQQGDVRQHECDVLVLKYAQARYGADESVAYALKRAGHEAKTMSPKPGAFRLLDSRGAVAATSVMFAGVDRLSGFDYGQIRTFARKALADLAGRDPHVARVAFTTHGAGYGLDEREAFEAQVAGFLDAIDDGDVPEDLTEITVVERDAGKVQRLEGYLADLIPDHVPPGGAAGLAGSTRRGEKLQEVGYSSNAKPHVFVAMPFSEEKSDHYHYAIQGAVHKAGYLCERVDLTAFTGDVIERVKARIESAELLVADLSGARPNVYLEVGYAWGKDVPTVLICDEVEQLEFDVQGQRCLTYASIRDLETKLTNELRGLG